jgi:hypothetical protein
MTSSISETYADRESGEHAAQKEKPRLIGGAFCINKSEYEIQGAHYRLNMFSDARSRFRISRNTNCSTGRSAVVALATDTELSQTALTTEQLLGCNSRDT